MKKVLFVLLLLIWSILLEIKTELLWYLQYQLIFSAILSIILLHFDHLFRTRYPGSSHPCDSIMSFSILIVFLNRPSWKASWKITIWLLLNIYHRYLIVFKYGYRLCKSNTTVLLTAGFVFLAAALLLCVEQPYYPLSNTIFSSNCCRFILRIYTRLSIFIFLSVTHMKICIYKLVVLITSFHFKQKVFSVICILFQICV